MKRAPSGRVSHSSPQPEHEIRLTSRSGPSGLDHTTYSQRCVCGWESPHGVGTPGLRAAEAAAAEHAEQHGMPYRKWPEVPAEITDPEARKAEAWRIFHQEIEERGLQADYDRLIKALCNLLYSAYLRRQEAAEAE